MCIYMYILLCCGVGTVLLYGVVFTEAICRSRGLAVIPAEARNTLIYIVSQNNNIDTYHLHYSITVAVYHPGQCLASYSCPYCSYSYYHYYHSLFSVVLLTILATPDLHLSSARPQETLQQPRDILDARWKATTTLDRYTDTTTIAMRSTTHNVI
jgi:hypothetical protein